MGIVVTGARGMLGRAFSSILDESGQKYYAFDSNSFDITNMSVIRAKLKSLKDVHTVCHFAAITDADLCELNPELALRVNYVGTKNISEICQALGMRMVFISSGMVFGGRKAIFGINDNPSPINVYGKSKLLAEKEVMKLDKNSLVVRSCWFFGGMKYDKKFVWKIIQLARTDVQIPVANDLLGSPTYTVDLSKAIVQLISEKNNGLFHIVNEGIVSRYEMATFIFDELKYDVDRLVPVPNSKFNLPAPRPVSEALVSSKNLRSWQTALHEYLFEIKSHLHP